ncbi:MAG: hypothetical protein DI533_21665 [Cereibacter sphaeroides]|uniref:RES domain-containing protein n=1 Tax=Cereibacter sphaeroides TaxID=1063 RepID=A0A2W5S0P9_CERSP|nr:MAG: hypothetical protein DI533_21665 [Cereibacter sphaeroides]
MPFFHATFKKNVPSILRHGLGAPGRGQSNWPGIDEGVYLSEVAAVSLMVMVEQYCRFGDADSVPREHFADVVVFVIDDARVDKSRLRPDPLITNHPVHRYLGIIDVTSMPVIPFDQLASDVCKEPAEEVSL